jgi:hypothetical protein
MSDDAPDHSIGWNVIFSTKRRRDMKKGLYSSLWTFLRILSSLPAQSSPCPTSPKLEKKRVETSRQKSVFSRSLVAQ